MIRTLTVLTALVFSGGLFADTLVWDTTGSNQFGKLDLSTGNFSQVSNFGFTAAGLGEIGDTVYTSDEGGTTLYSVNTNTGTVKSIGTSSISYYAFGSTTSGLYMVDPMGGLWNINATTGAATLIGSTHLIMGVSNYVGMSTGSGTLYLSLGSNIYTINTTTGLASFIGTSGSTDFGALVSVSNTVYGTSVIAPNQIYTFDPTTGMAAFLTNSHAPDFAFGLAAIVPEPSSFGLLGLGIAGCLLGGYALKRKQVQA